MISDVGKDEFLALKTLCESCGRASADRCLFMSLADPEAGLAAMSATAVRTQTGTRHNRETLYKVTSCPAYVAGGLKRG